MNELDLLKRIEELEKENKELMRYKEACDIAELDVWENNFEDGSVIGDYFYLFHKLGYQDKHALTLADITPDIHPKDLARGMKAVKACLDGEVDVYRSEMRFKDVNGEYVWFNNIGKVVKRNEEGVATRFVGLSYNVDERRLQEEVMKEYAYTDTLTGLGNRRMMYEVGNTEIERARRYKHPLTILLMDIDNFKHFNDTYGHDLGDKVLIEFSECLRRSIRNVDIKIRYGGDEFLVFLLEEDSQKAHETALRIQEELNHIKIESLESLTISIGVTELKESDTLDSFIKRCDNALYDAKKTGRDKVVINNE